jgi:hypothetical protein
LTAGFALFDETLEGGAQGFGEEAVAGGFHVDAVDVVEIGAGPKQLRAASLKSGQKGKGCVG